MALQTITIDPNAQYLSDNDIVNKINAATNQITRTNSVSADARPIQDEEITTEKLAPHAVTNTKASITLAKDNLDAMADLERGYIKTSPTSGMFKVISVERKSDGKLEVVYDDTPVL